MGSGRAPVKKYNHHLRAPLVNGRAKAESPLVSWSEYSRPLWS